ncbi:hypothetical protein DQ238_16030 [Geodermatophilus sp. TF02-6]|uniref:hypothetical protein n=1 Tax=Geodermatophilus sp. TF02-6 TaxID=2250575 RepID=UPI000DEBC4FA|nr:hypothetical protein [Geodermatophilus sp. TF02-6]RBY76780.1 hypothetical protein DQ238_16030 [Geodermatophilus sp. TF02-6]
MRGDGGSAHRPHAVHRRSSAPASTSLRTAGLTAGAGLAAAATVVVFVTEDPQVLRLAVLAAAWAFVLAALAASRRGSAEEHGGGPVVARREHELQAEHDLRREAERVVRGQLDALRAELTGVAELRRELARVTGLRADLAQLGAEVGRLRAELAEQPSGEVLIERILLRTQSTRTGAATVETSANRTIEQAPELTAAAPAVRVEDLIDGSGSSRPAEVPAEVHAEPVARPAPGPPWTAVLSAPPPDRLVGRSPGEPPAGTGPRRRRTDAAHRSADARSAEQPTVERPLTQRDRPPVPGPPEPVAPAGPPEEGSSRLAQILAENGVTPSAGGRRRRRYREDDEADDVLARVLGR